MKVCTGERAITVYDANGKKEYLGLEPDYLVEQDGSKWLPVTVLREEHRKSLVLIEFPHESEVGTNRIWVKSAETREFQEAQS